MYAFFLSYFSGILFFYDNILPLYKYIAVRYCVCGMNGCVLFVVVVVLFFSFHFFVWCVPDSCSITNAVMTRLQRNNILDFTVNRAVNKRNVQGRVTVDRR